MKKVELGLISDSDMHLLFEKGMIGRVSYFSKRYSKTNMKYLESFDPRQELKQIIYLDADNKYMVTLEFKVFPTGGFKWIDLNKLKMLCFRS